MSMDFPRFARMMKRSGQIVARGDVIPIVKIIYEAKLAGPANAYTVAHLAVMDAEKKHKKERVEGLVALAEIDQPYREARNAMAEFIKDLALPKTLKSLPTATDKLDAIERMLEILDARDETEEWARVLFAGRFGTLAPIAIREISEWIEADGDLEKAVRARAEAFAAAWPGFLSFRRQVRTSYGDSSVHHRQLVIRASGKLAVDDPVDEGKDEEEERGTDVEKPLLGDPNDPPQA